MSVCCYTNGLLSHKHHYEVQEYRKRGALAQDELVYKVSCKSIFEFQYSSYDICNVLFCLERHNTQFSLFTANNRQTYGEKEMCLFFTCQSYLQELCISIQAGVLH